MRAASKCQVPAAEILPSLARDAKLPDDDSSTVTLLRKYREYESQKPSRRGAEPAEKNNSMLPLSECSASLREIVLL